MFGLIGEKIGMTQIYDESGTLVPVTVVRLCPNQVTDVRTVERNGYASVQLGSIPQKESRVKKPQRAYFKKHGLNTVKVLKEFRTDKAAQFPLGASIDAAVFQPGDMVDVQGTSKGRGFQGVIKRWHFAGGADSHGCSISHRVPGSIGQRAYPGRVFPGKKMPGQMGDATVTLKNLKIAGVEAEQQLLLIRGAVPGGKKARLYIYPHANDFADRALKQAQAGSGKQAG